MMKAEQPLEGILVLNEEDMQKAADTMFLEMLDVPELRKLSERAVEQFKDKELLHCGFMMGAAYAINAARLGRLLNVKNTIDHGPGG